MGLIASESFTQVEWSKKLHRGMVLPEVMMLAQDNSMGMDMPLRMCNDGSGHKYQVQTAQPTVSEIAYGEGTPQSKSQSALERETATMIGGWSSVESKMADEGGQKSALLASEDAKFLKSMVQLRAQKLLYGSKASNIKSVNGFFTRFNALTGVKSPNTLNCAGATVAGQTSMLFVNWGPHAYGIFPEGTTGGYTKKVDFGVVTTLANGNKFRSDDTEHLLRYGLVLETWQAAGRICNIDTADITNLANNQAPTNFNNVLHKIAIMKRRLSRVPGVTHAYCNDALFTGLMRLGGQLSGSVLKVEDAVGQFGGTFKELTIYGIKIRPEDQILGTETIVT